MTLPEPRRITLFAGHYGSGKTNVALNYARRLRRLGSGPVTIADLDIVNPYFRTKDFADELLREGIGLVVSEFANSNVDFPAMPKEIYSLAAPGEGETGRVVMDIGGDDRGALALGRYVDDIRAGGDYEMVGVVNASRPLTRTPEDAAEDGNTAIHNNLLFYYLKNLISVSFGSSIGKFGQTKVQLRSFSPLSTRKSCPDAERLTTRRK